MTNVGHITIFHSLFDKNRTYEQEEEELYYKFHFPWNLT